MALFLQCYDNKFGSWDVFHVCAVMPKLKCNLLILLAEVLTLISSC